MLLDNPYKSEVKTTVDKSKLTVKDILDFADQVRMEDVRPIIDRQIKLNSAIAQEGLDNNLLELIANDPAFNMSLEDLQKTMDPSKYVGRSPEQVDEFLAEVINPILEENKEILGMSATINV